MNEQTTPPTQMKLNEQTAPPIEQLVQRVQRRDLSRSGFIAILAGVGASATGIATLLAATERAGSAALPPRRVPQPQPTASPQHHKQLHAAHVRRQGAATHRSASGASLSEGHMRKLQAIVEDYAPHAVVEDPLFTEPIVGKEAIAARKLAEMKGMRGVTIDVTHRFAYNNQVVAEWVLRGTHEGEVFGYAATGRKIEVRGVTVVTRENGKITRESLHYDVADVHRQLSHFA